MSAEKYSGGQTVELARIIHDASQLDAWGRIVTPWRDRAGIIEGGATASMDLAMAAATAVLAAGYERPG